jgi:hypothetical protein
LIASLIEVQQEHPTERKPEDGYSVQKASGERAEEILLLTPQVRVAVFEFVAQNAELVQKFQLRRIGQPVYSGR